MSKNPKHTATVTVPSKGRKPVQEAAPVKAPKAPSEKGPTHSVKLGGALCGVVVLGPSEKNPGKMRVRVLSNGGGRAEEGNVFSVDPASIVKGAPSKAPKGEKGANDTEAPSDLPGDTGTGYRLTKAGPVLPYGTRIAATYGPLSYDAEMIARNDARVLNRNRNNEAPRIGAGMIRVYFEIDGTWFDLAPAAIALPSVKAKRRAA